MVSLKQKTDNALRPSGSPSQHNQIMQAQVPTILGERGKGEGRERQRQRERQRENVCVCLSLSVDPPGFVRGHS